MDVVACGTARYGLVCHLVPEDVMLTAVTVAGPKRVFSSLLLPCGRHMAILNNNPAAAADTAGRAAILFGKTGHTSPGAPSCHQPHQQCWMHWCCQHRVQLAMQCYSQHCMSPTPAHAPHAMQHDTACERDLVRKLTAYADRAGCMYLTGGALPPAPAAGHCRPAAGLA